MISKEVLRFRKGDLLAVGFVILLAAVVAIGYIPRTDASLCRAEIYRAGELVETVSLQEDREITITDAYTNVIAVRDGKIGIIRSDCPGEDCVYSGLIGKANRSIVCLPNGVEIRLVADEADVDFVVR